MGYHSVNFRKFLEQVSDGAYDTTNTMGASTPEVTLEFPTKTVRGEVFRITVKGSQYCIQLTGGSTVMIPRKLYHQKYDRLPKVKKKGSPGDMVTAVFYKYKPKHEQNYGLKDFKIDQLR